MATPNERLLYAAKTDSEDMLRAVLDLPDGTDGWDVNFQDGLGMSALHYAAQAPSPSALELLLEHDGLDVDLQTKLQKQTPLHLAVKLENEDARQGVTAMLIDAGADPRIKDKNNLLPSDYLSSSVQEGSETDAEIVRMLKIAIGELEMGGVSTNGGGVVLGGDDIASDGEGEEGGSASEED